MSNYMYKGGVYGVLYEYEYRRGWDELVVLRLRGTEIFVPTRELTRSYFIQGKLQEPKLADF